MTILYIACASAAIGVLFARMLEYVIIKFSFPDPAATAMKHDGTPLVPAWRLFRSEPEKRANPKSLAVMDDPTTPQVMQMAALKPEDSASTNVNHLRCKNIIGKNSVEFEADMLQRQLKAYTDSLQQLENATDRTKRANLLRKGDFIFVRHLLF